jgi:serine/threonine protein kinase
MKVKHYEVNKPVDNLQRQGFDLKVVLDYLKTSEAEMDEISLDNDIIDKSIRVSRNVLFYKDNDVKYILKEIQFHEPGTLSYHRSRNIFKELRITKKHRSEFYEQCRYYTYRKDIKVVYLIYNYYHHSLANFIKGHNLDFSNKMSLMKNLLEALLVTHINGIILLDLSINSIRFTSDSFAMLFCSFGNSIDMSSEYDVERSSIIDKNSYTVHTAPEIMLKNIDDISWHSDIWSLGIILSKVFSDTIYEITKDEIVESYRLNKIPDIFVKNIKNVYIKAIIVGLLRINPNERPNIFQIIDVYNQLVERLEMQDIYRIMYSRTDVLSKID